MGETPQNPGPLISRKRHYFYVLVFSVAVWVFVAMIAGGFIPVYWQNNIITCECGEHYKFYNISFIIFALGGFLTALVFSYPLNRLILVIHSRLEDKRVPFSTMARYGKLFIGWRFIIFIGLTATVYCIEDHLMHKYFWVHPNKLLQMRCKNAQLFSAVHDGDISNVSKKIKEGADVNAKNNNGWTLLHWAEFRHHNEIAALLIDKSADVNAKDNVGRTPLHWAAMNSCKDTAALLIAKGADVNAKAIDGSTPLNFAASRSCNDTAALLIEKGADVDAKGNPFGWTPLHHTAFNGCKDFTALLIAKGADVNAKDNEGHTPLHWTARKDHKEVATLLTEKGANMNVKDNRIWTPLHWAAFKGHRETAALLIAKGADVNVKDNDGITPLHLAALNNFKDTVALLVEKGVDINALTYTNPMSEKPIPPGKTALDLAAFAEIKSLLRSHGAKTAEELKAAKK